MIFLGNKTPPRVLATCPPLDGNKMKFYKNVIKKMPCWVPKVRKFKLETFNLCMYNLPASYKNKVFITVRLTRFL